MRRFRYIFSCFLLLLALVLTSGVWAACTEVLRSGVTDSCCNGTLPDSPSNDAPCTEPDCQCVICHSFVVTPASGQSPLSHSITELTLRIQHKLPPQEYFASIDYPPEHA